MCSIILSGCPGARCWIARPCRISLVINLPKNRVTLWRQSIPCASTTICWLNRKCSGEIRECLLNRLVSNSCDLIDRDTGRVCKTFRKKALSRLSNLSGVRKWWSSGNIIPMTSMVNSSNWSVTGNSDCWLKIKIKIIFSTKFFCKLKMAEGRSK